MVRGAQSLNERLEKGRVAFQGSLDGSEAESFSAPAPTALWARDDKYEQSQGLPHDVNERMRDCQLNCLLLASVFAIPLDPEPSSRTHPLDDCSVYYVPAHIQLKQCV